MKIDKYLVTEQTDITPEMIKDGEKRRKVFNDHKKAYDSISVGIEKIYNDLQKTMKVGSVIDKKAIQAKITSFILGIKGLDFSRSVKQHHINFWTDYLVDLMTGKDPMDRARAKAKRK